MIIAVDFDGTLCRHEYPAIGNPNEVIIKWVREQQRLGAKLILHSCRSGHYLEEAIKWCEQFGLVFDAINDDIPETKSSPFGKEKSNKVYADLYLDDRSVIPMEISKVLEMTF